MIVWRYPEYRAPGSFRFHDTADLSLAVDHWFRAGFDTRAITTALNEQPYAVWVTEGRVYNALIAARRHNRKGRTE